MEAILDLDADDEDWSWDVPSEMLKGKIAHFFLGFFVCVPRLYAGAWHYACDVMRSVLCAYVRTFFFPFEIHTELCRLD